MNPIPAVIDTNREYGAIGNWVIATTRVSLMLPYQAAATVKTLTRLRRTERLGVDICLGWSALRLAPSCLKARLYVSA